jgi:hypothetical protein
MKRFLGFVLICSFFVPGISRGDFTGKGHVHTLSETKQVFLNSDCRSTGTCDLKRFTLTTSVYEVWFSDDPNHPTYGNGAIIEYETASVGALESYAIVQFKKGCVFYSAKDRRGKIERQVNDNVSSFGENIPFCFPQWVIDSQDSDPVYNSDPDYGRFYLLRWNKPGSYDERTQKYYGVEKPQVPAVYLADYPAGAFVTASGARNVALEYKSCVFRSGDVPVETQRENVHFAKPIACFEWQNVYVYDFDRERFESDLAHVPRWPEPAEPFPMHAWLLALLVLIALALVLARFRPAPPALGGAPWGRGLGK